MWVVVIAAIFALHDNPPRKTQAESNRSEVVAAPVVAPVKKPQATLTTQPKVEPKAPTPVAQPKPQPAPQPVKEVVKPVQGVTNCGDNPYKQYIYQHESGCRTNAVNSIGCAGLGQACPGSKLPCSLSDWVCQDNYFSNYAIQRYGSWQNAYNFWLSHRWW